MPDETPIVPEGSKEAPGVGGGTPGCLEGIRVLELGQLISGTYGGMLLADFGADVIKIEAPSGDIGRNPEVSSINGHSALFLTMNRGKRSVVLDLKSDLGISIFYRLVAKSDVVVANYRPGVLERLGIDYEHLRGINPAIVLCDISGFGKDATGPQPPSFDLTHQALSGLMGVTGEYNGPPTRMGIPIADIGTALFATLGIVSALVGRDRRGAGCEIDISMLEATTFLLNYDATMFLNTGQEPRAHGTAHAFSVPWQAFESANGWIVVAVREEKFWRAFCEAIDMADLMNDERFASNSLRVKNRDALVPLLANRMREKTTEEWLTIFAMNVPVAPVRTAAQALTAVDTSDSKSVVDVPYGPLGSVRMLKNPVRFDGTSVPYVGAPLLGEDTRGVLSDVVGLTAAEIDDLAARKVVVTGDAS
jgi:crotonobetainyl-CoA:carnitine CoA-transferase CaiB-like acyl-CoA transferase